MENELYYASLKVYRNWMIPEDRMIDLNNKNILIHPYRYVQLIQLLSGSDAALDALKEIIHERIDQIFNQNKS